MQTQMTDKVTADSSAVAMAKDAIEIHFAKRQSRCKDAHQAVDMARIGRYDKADAILGTFDPSDRNAIELACSTYYIALSRPTEH